MVRFLKASIVILIVLSVSSCILNLRALSEHSNNSNGESPNPVDDNSSSNNREPNQTSVYFMDVNDGVHGYELWKIDKTYSATLIKDINPGDSGSSSESRTITVIGNIAYFVADDGVHGKELWRSDGTELGTYMIKDINLQRTREDDPTGDSSPVIVFSYLDKIFFSADDGINGNELWITDGTESGTSLFKDINLAGNSNVSSDWILVGNKAYFAADNGSNGSELWITDFTEQGTFMLKEINIGQVIPHGPINSSLGSEPRGFVLGDNVVCFSASTLVAGNELWCSDGTEDGTYMISDVTPAAEGKTMTLGKIGSDFLFASSSEVDPWTIYKTTGEINNITAVFSSFLSIREPLVLNDKIYFIAEITKGLYHLWVTDGTEEGTFSISDADLDRTDSLIVINGKIVFTAHDLFGNELWVSDGTKYGTTMLMDINPLADSIPVFHAVYGNRLFFMADDGSHGIEPWSTDGTQEGTFMIGNLNLANDYN